MPPPVTPSPHRFVLKKQAAAPPLARRTPHIPIQPIRPPSTQQFAATPRFNFSSTPRPTPSQPLPAATPSAPRYLTPARPPARHEDIDISETSQDVQASIETEGYDADLACVSEEEQNDYEVEERTPKRRRLSFREAQEEAEEEADADAETEEEPFVDLLASPPLPILTTPATRRSKAPRFLLSNPVSSSTLQPFHSPPRFRPPSPTLQAQTQVDPLPDAFSPHRRGQKYLPGGLASQLQNWLVNIESSLPSSSKGAWLVKLVVQEVSGERRNGFTMVIGKDGDGPLQNVLLAGEGEGTGLRRGAEVQVGKTVGIKGPIWDLTIEGRKWGVGVDWKVLE